MKIEMSSSVVERTRLFAALSEPVRLAIVDRLLLGDASPGEVGRELDLTSSLVAHHLKLLEQSGIIERLRSEGDHRRFYLRLRTEALAKVWPTSLRTAMAARVVFVCTHNSARSQLATALWKRRSRVPAACGGTQPAKRVHPRAVAAAQAHGLSLARARTRHVDEVLRPDDLVVAVCDNAHEDLADRASDWTSNWLHWSVPDPARVDTDAAFTDALHDLADRVDRLAPAIHASGETTND